MKFKHHQDFPKEKEITSLNGFTIMENVGYNKALKVCGEIDVRESLDKENVRDLYDEWVKEVPYGIGLHNYAWVSSLLEAICKKFGKREGIK